MNETILANDVIQLIEEWAPTRLAYDWDNVGLQVGSLNKPINKVMVTLDVIESVVDEAIDNNVDLIIAHHPLLFSPMKQIDTNSVKGKILNKLIKNDITVYAAHTNLDVADGGVSDMLADDLGVIDTEVLKPSGSVKLYKLIIYVPETHTEKLTNAIGDHGAGHIGNYSHCSFQTKGTGAFKPLDGTTPFIGTQNQIEEVKEVKVETIATEEQLSSLISVVHSTHPYEEPAYDIIPLANQGRTVGVGRIGRLAKEMSLKEFCSHVKQKLDVPVVRFTGNLNDSVKAVAILGGSGKSYIKEAIQKGADVYVTGDMTFHEAQDGWQMGLNIVDPGHHVEKVMKSKVKKYLDEKLSNQNKSLDIIVSKKNTEPFNFI